MKGMNPNDRPEDRRKATEWTDDIPDPEEERPEPYEGDIPGRQRPE